jgi:hypothetical protein
VGEIRGACSGHGRVEMRTEFWFGSLKGRVHSEDNRSRWDDNIKMDEETRWEGIDWTIWLRTWSSSMLL